MDAIAAVAAPTQVARATTVVERVSTVNSIATATVSAVDVPISSGPVVRGPVRIDAPAGPSVGPRKVEVATNAQSIGTGTLSIFGTIQPGKLRRYINEALSDGSGADGLLQRFQLLVQITCQLAARHFVLRTKRIRRTKSRRSRGQYRAGR